MYKCSAIKAKRAKNLKNKILVEQMAPIIAIDHGGDYLNSHQKVDKLMTQMKMIGQMVAQNKVKPVGTKGNLLRDHLLYVFN